MKFLPTENITYQSKLKEDEIIRRLNDLIEPERTFRLGIFSNKETKPYEGQLSGHTFDIRRITDYRNSFLPRINGVIMRIDDGTIVKVKMRLNVAVVIFLCIWFGGVGIGCTAVLPKLLSSAEFNPPLLIPFGMLVFGYAITLAGFKFESIRSKKDLKELFQADAVNS